MELWLPGYGSPFHGDRWVSCLWTMENGEPNADLVTRRGALREYVHQ